MAADDIPENPRGHATSISGDYSYVAIDHHDYLLPVAAQIEVSCDPRETDLTQIQFRNFHPSVPQQEFLPRNWASTCVLKGGKILAFCRGGGEPERLKPVLIFEVQLSPSAWVLSGMGVPVYFCSMESSAASRSNRRGTALLLAVVAGYVDGYGLRVLNNYVSFMSGNTTFAGLEAGQGKFAAALAPGVAIAGFLAGSFAGSWLSHSEYRQARRLLFAASTGLMALFIALNFHSSLNLNLGIGMLSSAMGLLNPAVSRIRKEPLSLTFVTGTLNKIGGHLALAARRERPADAEGGEDTHLRRALLDAYIWAGFLAGAVLSGFAVSRLGRFALVPACAVLIVVALISLDG